MPSPLHDVLVELVGHRPEFAAELMVGVLGAAVPAHDKARLDSGQFSDIAPTEYRADAVVVLTEGGADVLAVVVEVQLRRDPDKRWSWPVYLATLRARLRCPATLLVMCVDGATARWCATPIDLGHPGWNLRPLVLGPEMVPVVDTAEAARAAPELAVLSALAHGADERHRLVLAALASGLSTIERKQALLYLGLVRSRLPEAAQHYLEELMSTGVDIDKLRERLEREIEENNRREQRAHGMADAVLRVLDVRGVTVPDDVRSRVAASWDLDEVRAWLDRAVTATTIDDVVD